MTVEETVQVMRDAVQAQKLGDLTLTTHSQEINGVLNRKGDPTGFAGKWYAGSINEILLTVALGSKNETIQTAQVTGAELRNLIEDGNVRTNNDNDASAVFYYGWSGIDVDLDRDGKVKSMKLNGEEMMDDAAKQYLLHNSPIKAPKTTGK